MAAQRTLTDWRDSAACADDPDTQFPAPTDLPAVSRARRVCAACPVRAECLRDALRHAEPHGVWGGFTPNERTRLAGGMPAAICAGCRLWFVPGQAATSRCYGCPSLAPDATYRPPAVALAKHREQITAWAAGGWSDRRIATELATTPYAVQVARGAWGIPAGYVVAQKARRGELVKAA